MYSLQRDSVQSRLYAPFSLSLSCCFPKLRKITFRKFKTQPWFDTDYRRQKQKQNAKRQMHILKWKKIAEDNTIGMNILNFPIKYAFALSKLPNSVTVNTVRHGHRLRGKRPGIARSITDRLAGEVKTKKRNEVMLNRVYWIFCFAEEYAVDMELVKSIDIGFPAIRSSRAEKIAMKAEHFKQQKLNANLEKLSRTKQCKLALMGE